MSFVLRGRIFLRSSVFQISTPLERNVTFFENLRSRRYETLTFEKATLVEVAMARGRANGGGSGWVACGGTCGLWLFLGPCLWPCPLLD